MIATSTEALIPGYVITAYKGIVQGETWDELLRQAEKIGANAVLNTRFDDGFDVETLFHGTAVILRRVRSRRSPSKRPKPRKLQHPTRRGQ